MDHLTIRAPAKVNLSLEVMGRRTDGYHEVRTVLQSIGLSDQLTFEPAGTLALRWDPGSPVPVSQVPAEENLALRAAKLLQKEAGVTSGAAIMLHKVIPVAAGLGGGSSDAAATLLGLRQLWGLDVSHQRLAEIAAMLGSDVPFFLRGGTALGSGRGDKLQELPAPIEQWAVISTSPGPPQSDKTAQLYRLLTPAHYSQGARQTEQLVRRLHAGTGSARVLFNTFESVASDAYPDYVGHKRAFVSAGAPHVLLAGAGPSLFSLTEEEASAIKLRDHLARLGYGAYAVRLLPRWGPGGLPA
jgi:4-diphosphocytidyl-2-C-methyl-D-erythritol kinase